jgi:hypothetical protein
MENLCPMPPNAKMVPSGMGISFRPENIYG